jgi:protein phosphatase
MQLDCYALSEQGPDRDANEDAFALDAAAGLFAVADGMGGRPGGALASRTALETVMRRLRPGSGAPHEALVDAFRKANARLRRAGKAETAVAGLGTTLSLLMVRGEMAYVGHVGDSRVYRVRGGDLTQVTTDDSLVAELVSRGHITAEMAARHPMRGRLTKALGTQDPAEPQLLDLDLAAGDTFVLATDGLAKALPQQRLEEIARDRGATTAESLCRTLIDEAMAAPLEDDLTVAVVAWPDHDNGRWSE